MRIFLNKKMMLWIFIIVSSLSIYSCSKNSSVSLEKVKTTKPLIHRVDNYDYYTYTTIMHEVPYLTTLTYGWAFPKDRPERAVFFLSTVSNSGLGSDGVPLGDGHPLETKGQTIYEEYIAKKDKKNKNLMTFILMDGSCGQTPFLTPELFKTGIPIKFERSDSKIVFANSQGEDVTALKDATFKNILETLDNPRCPDAT